MTITTDTTTTKSVMTETTTIKEREIINFKKLEKADKPIFDKFYNATYCESSKYTFTNLYMWRNFYNIFWTVEDDVLFTFAENDKNFSAWQPFGAADKMQDAIKKFLNFSSEFKNNKDFKFDFLEKDFAEELKKYPDANFKIKFNPAYTDYIYMAENLINLSGRKFHGKKNHLNQFYKDYPSAEYLPLNFEIIPQCLELLELWYEMQINDPQFFSLRENLAHEKTAIHEILEDFNYFGVKGGAILFGKKVMAFTFGEQLNSDTAVIHVEKADPTIRGAYAAINQNFIAHEWTNMTYINREEDMGLEGLRQAKESYRPVKLIEKFSAKIIV